MDCCVLVGDKTKCLDKVEKYSKCKLKSIEMMGNKKHNYYTHIQWNSAAYFYLGLKIKMLKLPKLYSNN